MSQTISEYDYGLHCLLIYSDLSMLREFYSRYIPEQIKYKEEIIQINPFYETEESVRQVLYKGYKGMNMDKIDEDIDERDSKNYENTRRESKDIDLRGFQRELGKWRNYRC